MKVSDDVVVLICGPDDPIPDCCPELVPDGFAVTAGPLDDPDTVFASLGLTHQSDDWWEAYILERIT